jgi:hypothetical protein
MPRAFRHDKDADGAVAMTRHQRRQCDTPCANQPNLLVGAKWRLAHEVHAWATSQWFNFASLGAMVLVDCLLQTKIIGCGGKPADGSVGGSAATVPQALGLTSLDAVLEWTGNGTAPTDRAALRALADWHSWPTFAAIRSSASSYQENQPVCDCRSVAGDVPQFPNRTWRMLVSVESNEEMSPVFRIVLAALAGFLRQ